MDTYEECTRNVPELHPSTHICSGRDTYNNACLECLPLTKEDVEFNPRSLFVAGQSVLVKPMANESPSQFYLLPQELLKVWDAVNIRHRFEIGNYSPEYFAEEDLPDIGQVCAFYDRFGDAANHRARYMELVEYNEYHVALVDAGCAIVWKTSNEMFEISDDSVSSAPSEAVLCSLMVEHPKFEGEVQSAKIRNCTHKMYDIIGCRFKDVIIVKAYVLGTLGDCVNVRLVTPEDEDVTTLLVTQDYVIRSQGLVPGDPPETEDFSELVNRAVSFQGDSRALFQDGAVIDVRVVHIESSRRFWAVPVARDERRKQLIKECPFGELTDWYKLSTFNTPPSDPIEKGKMYWISNNGALVRGIVVATDSTVRRCLGRTLDTGDVIEVNPDDEPQFCTLADEFIKMPPLVVECCLDIQPKNGAQEWSKEAVLHFHKSFTDGQFPYYDGKKIYEAVPTGQVRNGRIEVVLKDGEKNFAKELLKLGFGEYMPQEDLRLL